MKLSGRHAEGIQRPHGQYRRYADSDGRRLRIAARRHGGHGIARTEKKIGFRPADDDGQVHQSRAQTQQATQDQGRISICHG
ncbi:hypothetical protein ABI_27280 [Asticcacaulis biprosthecium C19]|uniref:Uncharacterized protein n=1 Tax=Asticcacaulis biprosthecium C19 TaxID=715226 RepID=F4QM72_9CAUL|nr:hypothetical protein ABI_27280 [Asticcacaulis biprosthecium C19]